MLQGQSGALHGQPQLPAPLQNGAATFQFACQEAQRDPNRNVMAAVLHAQDPSPAASPMPGR